MVGTGVMSGKRAIVTGGSRGLGRAIALRLAADGADVAFNYSKDTAGAEATRNAIEAAGRRTLPACVSVLDAVALEAWVREIEKTWGGVDILVNNAGISQSLPLALLEEADWDKVMDINVKGQFLTARTVVRGMIRAKKGVILNIGSLAGVRMLEAPIHYSASKAAVKGFTEALCKDVARHNIRVNCLAPGLLEEGVGQSLPDYKLKQYLDHVALRRLGRLEEVAACAAFLVSDRNSYMNGETILMDGGL